MIVDRQLGNEEMAKTSLSTEPEWEDPVQLSCDTGDQVQTHFQRIDMLISGPGHF